MPKDDSSSPTTTPEHRGTAVSTNAEGSAQHAQTPRNHDIPMPENAPAEIGALHVRMIALENLVIALLAKAPDEQIELARDMASYISPREGFTQHPLTTLAGAHMIDLIQRANRFKDEGASSAKKA